MLYNADLKVASWNLNGACDPDRVRAVRTWLKTRSDIGIIGFQELKAREFQAERNLRSIFQTGTVVIDYASNNKGGSALVIDNRYKVIDSGVKGDGSVAWAKIDTKSKGVIGVISLYASTKTVHRIPLWCWLEELMEGGRWILIGDFNSVELPDDTQGNSNLLNGTELRKWKSLARTTELTDVFFTAITRRSPRFTRHRVRLDRIEFARLDRCYLTDGADWVEHVKELVHDGSSGLSDHYPVVVELQLAPEDASGAKPWRTYFKFRVEEMRSESVRAQVEQAWTSHPPRVSDPLVKWELGWKRVKKIMQRIRKEQRDADLTAHSTSDELTELRVKIASENSEANRNRLVYLETKAKDKELRDARAWRLRSRARWLREGDAPSHYFFSMLKSKCKREEMVKLERDDGSVITGKDEILQETQRFYQSLFSEEDRESAEDPEALARECLGLIRRRLNPGQSKKLEEPPDMAEVDHIVKILPSEKAPGLDGVTAEVIREYWELIRSDCLELMLAFWQDGRLTSNMKKGAIKLIPKSEEKSKLKDWRPISLLGIMYKILSKLLAERLKGLLPGLVDGQQTGFVLGRSIFDSVLAIKLGQEWSQMSGQQSLFLKLDFVKAYDRVSHSYLWRVLDEMGFGQVFINLLKGLVEKASSVVHINGAFTGDIQLDRGVRQGCPIAPLLFSLSTQPLMAMLKEAQIQGQVEGLELGDSKQMLEALFADDTGLILRADEDNWRKATAVVRKFELLSGAKLNVSKSLVVPIGFSDPPDWLVQTGCRIATEGEVYTYLGCPFGVKLSDEQITQFLLDKLTRRLHRWTNRFLTWEGRAVLTKHVLQTMPNYVLMTVGLTGDGYSLLTGICRRFIWGNNSEGNEKKVLISWEKMCRKKEEGGMGLIPFDLQAKALKMRLVTKILEEEDLDWVHIASTIVEWKILDVKARRDEIGWPIQHILILGKKLQIPEAQTLSRIFEGWWECRVYLNLKSRAPLPASLGIRQAINLKFTLQQINSADRKLYLRLLKKSGVTILADLNDESLQRMEANELAHGRPEAALVRYGPQSRILWLIYSLQQETSTDGSLHNPRLWVWALENKQLEGWSHSAKEWRWLLGKHNLFDEDMNRKWNRDWERKRWENLWTYLWRSQLFLRDKIWVWKVLHRGIFVHDKLLRMNIGPGLCPKGCQNKTGSIPVSHLLLEGALFAREIATTAGSKRGRVNAAATEATFSTLAEREHREMSISSRNRERLFQRSPGSDNFTLDSAVGQSSAERSELSSALPENTGDTESREPQRCSWLHQLNELEDDLNRLGFLAT
ncbi:hypothetical protein R1sor_011071 [Riccia sorocarpa]|uniref:Reverse transcriptase domain-containing protein n=1 Tax=Riccia sorocarpa TaxID=122646 RepID=A0ABD3I3Q2_9MARC